jgi:hypothetical protein
MALPLDARPARLPLHFLLSGARMGKRSLKARDLKEVIFNKARLDMSLLSVEHCALSTQTVLTEGEKKKEYNCSILSLLYSVQRSSVF